MYNLRLENGVVTDTTLKFLQSDLSSQYYRTDVYHSERHRGILVLPHTAPLIAQNILLRIIY